MESFYRIGVPSTISEFRMNAHERAPTVTSGHQRTTAGKQIATGFL
jgi:hypothetical protein